MPTVFIGHGNPMNAVELNGFTRSWREMAAALPRPGAILSVSAHWYVPGARVTAEDHPRTIHDFGGFPRVLYEVQYPAPGSRAIAARVRDLLAPIPVALDDGWGLDHGTWSVLTHLFPAADLPVIQLGVDANLGSAEHFELARQLRPLRDEGVLVLGSGNVVHNLHAYAWGERSAAPYDWAVRFEAWARDRIVARDFPAIVAYERLGVDATLATPTPDHFLPLLYVLAISEREEPISFPLEGFDGGSVSMLCVRAG